MDSVGCPIRHALSGCGGHNAFAMGRSSRRLRIIRSGTAFGVGAPSLLSQTPVQPAAWAPATSLASESPTMIRGSPGNRSEAMSKIRQSGFSTPWSCDRTAAWKQSSRPRRFGYELPLDRRPTWWFCRSSARTGRTSCREHHICKATLQVKVVEVGREIVVPQSQAGEALLEGLEPHLLEVGHLAP